MQRAVNAGIVIVIAAGNDGTPANPDPFALTPAQKFPGSVIIAGSVGATIERRTDVDHFGFLRQGRDGRRFLSCRRSATTTGARQYRHAVHLVGHQLLRADDQRRGGASGAGIPQPHRPADRRHPVQECRRSRRDGVDAIYGHGKLDIARAFQPIGTTSLADCESAGDRDQRRPAGPPATPPSQQALGAIILDGYNRAYVLNLAATLRKAQVDHPLSRSLQNDVEGRRRNAGPLSIAMTVRERHDLVEGFGLERIGIGPEDLRKSRLVAGSAVARLDNKTAVAFGFAEGAKAMERRLTGAAPARSSSPTTLSATPVSSRRATAAWRCVISSGRPELRSPAESGDVWQEVKTSATGSPYRWTSVAVDRSFGRNWLSLGLSRLEEKQIAARRPHDRRARRRRLDAPCSSTPRRGTISAAAGPRP